MDTDPAGHLLIPDDPLPGRKEPVTLTEPHAVLGTPLQPPYPDGTEIAEFALGCTAAAEPHFWGLPGVYTTAVGYEGGITPNPAFHEVGSGRTGHAETVRIVYDPATLGYTELLKVFWETHDPTQGMRQGSDIGTQYRSVIFYHNEAQEKAARASKYAYQKALSGAGHGAITTRIIPARTFYFNTAEHQQFLHNPAAKFRIEGTGITCPITHTDR